jgi:hypothetical protein
MRRSRLTGRTRANDTEFGWYFAGEPMDKRHSRGGRIRLVRYEPEVPTCIHSRCPSPSPDPEQPLCTCNKRCELHCPERHPHTPSSNASSGAEPVRCRVRGGFHTTKRERSPQAEKVICTCNNLCEFHTREDRPRSSTDSELSDGERLARCACDFCRAERRERANGMRPGTSSSSDSSDSERVRRHRYNRTATRESETFPQFDRWHREVYTHTNTPATSTRFSSRGASFTATRHPAPIVHHLHCHKAMYCEEHPELCRAIPSPLPSPTPTRTPRQSDGKPRPVSGETPTQGALRCICGRYLSPEPVSPVAGSPRPAPRTVKYCSCFRVEKKKYYVDETGYFTPVEDDTSSEISTRAMPGNEGDQDEAHCPLYHRCRPRFEYGHGWVCGRK